MHKFLKTYGVIPNTNPFRYQVTSQTTGATFQINNAKIYVPMFMLMIITNF